MHWNSQMKLSKRCAYFNIAQGQLFFILTSGFPLPNWNEHRLYCRNWKYKNSKLNLQIWLDVFSTISGFDIALEKDLHQQEELWWEDDGWPKADILSKPCWSYKLELHPSQHIKRTHCCRICFFDFFTRHAWTRTIHRSQIQSCFNCVGRWWELQWQREEHCRKGLLWRLWIHLVKASYGSEGKSALFRYVP